MRDALFYGLLSSYGAVWSISAAANIAVAGILAACFWLRGE